MKPKTDASPNVSLSIWAKLSTQLTLLILLLSTVPLMIVGYLAFDNGRRTIKQNTIDRLNSITILKEAEFNLWVQGHERSLQALAQRPLVREYAAVLSAYDTADPEHQSLHISLHQDHLDPALAEGDWLELFLLRVDDGLLFFSTNNRQEGKYRENDPYFVEGQDHTYVKNVYYSLTLEETAMAISTPVKDGEGNLIAVLVGRLDLTTMSQIMAQGRELTASEETYLVNKFNFLATESRFSPGYALNKAIHTEGIDKCLLNNKGVGLYDDYREVPVIGVYRWLPQRELCILTEIDQSEAFAPIVTFGNAILGIGVAVALIVGFLALSFARTITVPVSQLTQGAEEIGQGNLAYRIKVKARNEFGQLAAVFNDMAAARERAADALQRAHDELERKVEQRTADLTLANENLQVEIAERKRMEEALRESKERFESITAQSPIPMVITKPNGDIEYFNDKFTELFGYTLEDVSTAEEWWGSACPDEDYRRFIRESWEKAMAQAAGTQTQIETQEWDLTSKDRSIRRVEFDMMSLGEMSVIILNDITERVQAEEALRKVKYELEMRVVERTHKLAEANVHLEREIKECQQSEEKFRTLLESAPVAVVIVDGNGRIELINSQAEQIFDCSRDELLGQTIEVLLPE